MFFVKSSNIQYLLTDRISQRNLPQWNGNGSWPKFIVFISVEMLVVSPAVACKPHGEIIGGRWTD